MYLAIVTHIAIFARTVDPSTFLLHALDQLLAGFVLAVRAQAERMTGFDVELTVKHLLLTLRNCNVILLGYTIFCDRL